MPLRTGSKHIFLDFSWAMRQGPFYKAVGYRGFRLGSLSLRGYGPFREVPETPFLGSLAHADP
jgi:hypothetical protein